MSLLDELVDVAERAGRATLPWFQNAELTVEHKPDGTPVTEADRAAERLIRDHIERHHPQDAVLGEEEGRRDGTTERRWYIDPIDGTRSFVHGVPLYATLVAVEDADGVAAGVICLPALGETVAAARGEGCWWNGSRAQVNTTSQLAESSLSRSEYGQTLPQLMQRLEASPLRLLTWGDAYGYALVATGRLEAMLDPFVNAWDIAPMPVIMNEAGGRFTDATGASDLSSSTALASNGLVHDDILSILG